MIRSIFFGVISLLTGYSVQAKEVPLQDACKAGINFYFERVNQFHSVDYTDIRVIDRYTCSLDGIPAYYVFNLSPGGFVIVSADDAVVPVLGYSFDGSCNQGNPPPQFTAWMKQYEDQIRFARERKISPNITAQLSWNYYLNTPSHSLHPFKNQQVVAPLLTSRWNQSIWYNEGCPADPGGPGGHALAGCVPTAMGQLMNYYRWPASGVGSYSYLDSTYGILSADFQNSTYDWNKMLNAINSSNPGIAQLLFHLGVSCDLHYGPTGSGMYNHKAAYSLRTYFKYSPQTQYLYRDSTNLNWDSILVAHLDRKMPMYYAGWSVPNIDGHAFICDGYQDTAYFHFNFGWSGSSDGYYYTDNLVAGGGSFNLAQELIINCYPDTVNYIYPLYCSGPVTFMEKNGTFEDGSGPVKDYHPETTCSWLIAPQIPDDSVSSITLSFQRFNTLSPDVVTVYDGATSSSPVLGNFSGESVPSALTSTGNKMLVSFASGSGKAPGWLASYSSNIPVWCNTQTEVTADTFNITDGSFEFNYHNNTSCRWKFSRSDSTPVTLYFKYFDTEPGKDFLRIYDFSQVPVDTLASLSGHYETSGLPDSVTAPKGQMMIVFTSNSSITGKGWEIFYPKSHVGIAETDLLQGLKLYPNPAQNNVTVRFELQKASGFVVKISTIDGREVMHQTLFSPSGKNEITLDVSGLKAGIYLLKLENSSFISIKKLVIR